MSASAGKRARKPVIKNLSPDSEEETFEEEPQQKKRTKKSTTPGTRKKGGRPKKQTVLEVPPATTTTTTVPETTTSTTETSTTAESIVGKAEEKETKEEEKPTKAEQSPEAVANKVNEQLGTTEGDRWLEKGHIFFFYRPKVEVEHVEGLDDVQRLYILLSPIGAPRHNKRLIVLTKKRLPDIHKHSRFWGFVDKATDDVKEIHRLLDPAHYSTETRGERTVGAARPAGEGFYGIMLHEKGHTHLAYVLELPHEPGEVQKAFNIEKEGSYIIAVKNPSIPNPPGAGLQPEKKATFPEELAHKFGNKRWIPLNPPTLLDFDGTELLIIAAKEDIVQEFGDKGEELEKDEIEDLKKLTDSSLFEELHLGKKVHPPEPLLQGTWQ